MVARNVAAVSAVMLLLVVAPRPLAVQPPETPRTPWGAPDLGGVWDYRSLTPLSRSDAFRDQALLTDEQAAAYVRDLQASRERFAPPFQRAFVDRGTNTVADRRSSLIVDPPTGRYPRAVAGAAERRAAFLGSYRRDGIDSHEDLNFIDRCRGSLGLPLVPGPYNNNVQIFQTPDHVAILAESVHLTRIIPLDGRPRAGLPQFRGDGRGYWDGDTLVVESTNFDGELTMIGTEPQRLVERFSRSGDTIQYEFTVDDPKMWRASWTARVPLRQSDDPLFEYACHEGNYSVENMLLIARGTDRSVR
jgi:hypothetical protein